MSDDLWRDTTPLRAPRLDEPFERRSRRQVVTWSVVAVLLLGVVAGPLVWFLAVYGCDGGDAAYARQLARNDVLDLTPPGAQPVGGRDTGCEDDDEMAMASQDYRRGELTREEVVAFYDRALTAAGWTPAPSPQSAGCWNRQVGERGVSLFVEQDFDPDRFKVQVSGQDRDGGWGWCA